MQCGDINCAFCQRAPEPPAPNYATMTFGPWPQSGMDCDPRAMGAPDRHLGAVEEA